MNTQQILAHLSIPSDFERPSIEPPDGNAFSIIAAVSRAVRRVDPALAARYNEVVHQSDSYSTILSVASELVSFDFGDEDEEDEG